MTEHRNRKVMNTLVAEARAALAASWKSWKAGQSQSALVWSLAVAVRRGADTPRVRRIERALGPAMVSLIGDATKDGATRAQELLGRMKSCLDRWGTSILSDQEEAGELVCARENLDAVFQYVRDREGRDDASMGRWMLTMSEIDAIFAGQLDDFLSTEDLLISLQDMSHVRRGWSTWMAGKVKDRTRVVNEELRRQEPWIAMVSEAIQKVAPAPTKAPKVTPLPPPKGSRNPSTSRAKKRARR